MYLSEQEIVRRNKLHQLQELGIESYPAEAYPISNSIQELIQNYNKYKKANIAGRIMSTRIMGKTSFTDIKDHSGSIQLYINDADISNHEIFKKLLELGDIIGVQGFLFQTRMGEITLHVKKLTLLCKALRPLPQVKKDKKGKIFDAFSDTEQRYRMRYVDLIVNDSVKDIFIKRTKIIQFLKEFLNSHGYIEVETPILQTIVGGASARPFITHHNSLDLPLYLRIANELYLKRLIVGGFNGVYEFSKDFRNEGMDRMHNPEFTVLEFYVAYKDYYWMMDFTEKMMKNLCLKINNSTEIFVGDTEISFQTPFKRISIYESIHNHTGIDVSNMDEENLIRVCKDLHIVVNKNMNKGKLLDVILSEKCEKHYIQPTLIIDYPVEMSPLSKKHRNKKGLTERFELFINGKEIANAYSELNDPIDQLERFKEQLKLAEVKHEAKIDDDFIRALEFGMPPAAGIGIGIDRLVMLLTGQTSIQEVIFFPQMRPEQQNQRFGRDSNPRLRIRQTRVLPAKLPDL